MHARYYSPNLGRFVSVDPVGGEVGSSQSWNRYAYVDNNPVVFIDPEGQTKHYSPFAQATIIQFNSNLREGVSSTLQDIPGVGMGLSVVGDAALAAYFPVSMAEQSDAAMAAAAGFGPMAAFSTGLNTAGKLVDGVTKGPLLSWNRFQKLFAKQGYSTAEKSELFKVYKVTGIRPRAKGETIALAMKSPAAEAEQASRMQAQLELQRASHTATSEEDVVGFLARLLEWIRGKSN
jgi:hypothetical protein